MVEDAIAALIPYARERKVTMAIEPLHPMYAAERSCITSLEEANILAEKFDAGAVGIVVDVYHVWWDAMLERELTRARGRIRGFHVCDWLVPTPDMLMGRGMMGDGCIDIHRIRTLVEGAGYAGSIEVGILNQAIWDHPSNKVLQRMKERFCPVCSNSLRRTHARSAPFHVSRNAPMSGSCLTHARSSVTVSGLPSRTVNALSRAAPGQQARAAVARCPPADTIRITRSGCRRGRGGRPTSSARPARSTGPASMPIWRAWRCATTCSGHR